MSRPDSTIALTGASGFIGRHVRSALRKRGAPLLLVTRRPFPDLNENETELVGRLEDLDPQAWAQTGITEIDTVIHLAAFFPKSGSTANDAGPIFRGNLQGTQALLDSLPGRPPRVVLASTVDVYNMNAIQPGATIDEAFPVGPASLYGASKPFCEEMVRVWANRVEAPFAILRYGHIFGPGEEAHIKLIPRVIHRLMRGEAPMVWGDGTTTRDFLYVGDAVEATLRAVDHPASLDPINVVRGAAVSIDETVQLLARLTSFAGEVRYLLDKPPGISLRFDSTRMRSCLGTWPLVSLEEGLRREIAHMTALADL